MPSPNVANKTPTKKAAENTENLGQKLAKRKSQNLNSKITGWNETGAGIAQKQNEVVVVEDAEEIPEVDSDAVGLLISPEKDGVDVKDFAAADASPAPKTPMKTGNKQTTPRKTSREIDAAKKAWVRRRSKPQLETSLDDVKKAGVPKKRVVSDGHWRRDRLEKKEAATPEKEKEKEKEKEITPKPVIIRRSVVNVGLKVPPSVQNFEQEQEPAGVRPRIRRPQTRSRSRDREYERGATPDYESSGTKVYVKRRRRSRTLDPPREPRGLATSESSLTASSSFEKRSSATDITTPERSPTRDEPPRPSSAPKPRIAGVTRREELLRDRSTRPSLEAEDVPRRVSHRKSRTPVPAIKRPDSAPKVFGSRIEGWLANTSNDPFVESRDRSLTPEPLCVPRKKSRRFEDVENDSDINQPRSSTRRRQSRPSLEAIDTNERSRAPDGFQSSIDAWIDDSQQLTTPTLKRRGARRNTQSPVKDRSLHGVSEHTDEPLRPADIVWSKSRRVTDSGARELSLPSRGNQLAVADSFGTLPSRPLPLRPRGLSNSSEQLTIIPDGSVLSRASDGDEPARNPGGLKRRLTKHSDLMSVLSLPRDDEHKIKSARSIRTHRVRNEHATIGDLMNEVSTDELKYQRELRTLVDGVIPVLLTNALSKNDAARASGSRQTATRDNAALTQPIYEMGVALEKLKASHKRIPMHDPNELLLWVQSSTKVYDEYLKVWRLGFENIVVNLAPADEAEKTNGIQSDVERVDVAYLLKRPLVRVKNFAKTLSGINQVKPSALAEDMTATYEQLVLEARKRANDERARLEDEAAAAIDPTRARDPRSLQPLNGVNIDPTRNVRARDFFDMQLFHSSGQQLDCKIEIIRRDNAPSCPGTGDVLFCEVLAAGKWLLFPPVLASQVSARKGDKEGEILVMVRGMLSSGNEWREIMVLQATEEQVAEWLQILGCNPLPPRLNRQSSFNTLRDLSGTNNRPTSPTESEMPIGEQARPTAPTWDGSDVNSVLGDLRDLPPPLSYRTKAARYRSTPSSPLSKTTPIAEERLSSEPTPNAEQLRYTNDSPYGAKPKSGHARSKSEWIPSQGPSTPKKDYNVWLPSSERDSDESSAEEDDQPKRRPSMHKRTSSVPAADFPTVPKLRKSGPSIQAGNSYQEQRTVTEPTSAPSKLQKPRLSTKSDASKQATKAPAPLHSGTTSLGLRSGALPSFTPEFLKRHRRSSSPLKHEYDPSTASDSFSDSDLSDPDDGESETSDTSAEDDIVSTIGELKDFSRYGNLRPVSRPKSTSHVSVEQDTLGPSDSPSQRPYRGVPPTNNGSAKSVSCIFSWSERGSWDSLHPEECEIVVTPGLIEAFDLSQAHAASRKANDLNGASPSTHGVRPLVALELTPLVPLRRGTALDISIRSPPTSNSLLRNSNNIMFRSRSPEECEKLYALINRARIDNPTWIALQNARGPVKTSNWAEAMDRRNAARSDNPSFLRSLSRKGGSYRSKGSRPASFAASQSSVGTMNSAMSAIRRFSGGSIFNIAKSTINSKESTRSSYSSSLSSGAATPVPFDPAMGTPVGITNAKCRFYMRETESKWRDMGSSRLTIMLPARSNPASAADPRTVGLTKRVLVCGKSKGEVLFDEILFENSFERINRTGIAVTVWQELTGPNGEVGRAAATGGVSSSRTRTYMIQMKSEREAAFTFSMVGKLRY